jgi:hypothetical protein
VSVLDDLRAAESRVAARLKELRPAVDEYRELEAVAERLGIDVSPAPATKPAPVRRTRRSPRKSAKTTPGSTDRSRSPDAPVAGVRAKTSSRRRAIARPGQRGEQLVELVRARPGITVRQAGGELGVDPTSLYRIVRRLEASGEVRKNGRGLEPVAPTA